MHREIAHYLEVHNFDDNTSRYGIINEGKRLLEALERNDNDESKFLRDIEIYNISASNGNAYISKKETRTFLNIGMFSFYYHGDCYKSTIFDTNGRPTGGSHWITDNKINEPSIICYSGEASGKIYIYADTSDERKKQILDYSKRETIYKCREKFGRW